MSKLVLTAKKKVSDFKFQEKETIIFNQEKNLFGHFEDFKNLIIQVFFVWLFFTTIAFFFNQSVLSFVLQPLKDSGNSGSLLLIRPTDGFVVLFKICAITGLIFSLPINLFLVWRYFSPALLSKEKRLILKNGFIVLFLTLVAVAYGYFNLIPASLNFLLNLKPSGTTISLTITEYIDFLTFLILILVLVFQTPLILFILLKTRILKPKLFQKNRRYIYFFTAVILAILTPTPDVFTLILITIPILIMMEIAYFFGKQNKDHKLVQISNNTIPKKDTENTVKIEVETTRVKTKKLRNKKGNITKKVKKVANKTTRKAKK